jgi:hypothetical protein
VDLEVRGVVRDWMSRYLRATLWVVQLHVARLAAGPLQAPQRSRLRSDDPQRGPFHAERSHTGLS